MTTKTAKCIGLMILAVTSCNASAQADDDLPQIMQPQPGTTQFVSPVGEYAEVISTIKQDEQLISAIFGADKQQRAAAIETIKTNPDKYIPETLYALSSQLFVDGNKDEAIYWFYLAFLRTRSDAYKSKEICAEEYQLAPMADSKQKKLPYSKIYLKLDNGKLVYKVRSTLTGSLITAEINAADASASDLVIPEKLDLKGKAFKDKVLSILVKRKHILHVCPDDMMYTVLNNIHMKYLTQAFSDYLYNLTPAKRKEIVNAVVKWDVEHKRSYNPKWLPTRYGMQVFISGKIAFAAKDKWQNIDAMARADFTTIMADA